MEDEQVDEIKRHLEMIAESLRDEIKLVAGGHDMIRRDMQKVQEEMSEEFEEMKATIGTTGQIQE